mgnify:CR=1 FL=1
MLYSIIIKLYYIVFLFYSIIKGTKNKKIRLININKRIFIKLNFKYGTKIKKLRLISINKKIKIKFVHIN